MNEAPSDAVFCIYCEDIRQEVNGMMSVIGWFGTRVAMPPNGDPLRLPKLCAVISIRRENLTPIKSLRVTMQHNGKVLQDISPSPEQLAHMQEHILNEAVDHQFRGFTIKINLQMLFFSVAEPGKLSTLVEIDGQPAIESERLNFVR